MHIKFFNLKASQFFSLAVLTVSLLGMNGMTCKASQAEELKQDGQSTHHIGTTPQSSLVSERTDVIYAKMISQDGLDSLNGAVSIPESSPSFMPFLAVGALLFIYKKNR